MSQARRQAANEWFDHTLYLHELTIFPKGRHDDQVDSTARMLDWVKQAGRESGFLEYYRMLAEDLRDAPPVGPAPLSTRFGLHRR